jgi:hypothetical protein
MDYNPLNCQLYPIQLVQKVEVTGGQHLPIYRCQTTSQVSLFVRFLISWINLPMKTMKIGTPRIKVISQYFTSKYKNFLSIYVFKIYVKIASLILSCAVNLVLRS